MTADRTASIQNSWTYSGIVDGLKRGDAYLERGLGRHWHIGYWGDPSRADGSVEDCAKAAEELSRRMSEHAGIRDGMRVLDCGCGVGGTIASLNERYANMELVGLNIDERQLEVARERVKPVGRNKVEFRQGDACQLPFADASFDAVFAVECIFHFPSRQQFLREAERVLKKGGRLVVTDIIPRLSAGLQIFGMLKEGLANRAVLDTLWGSWSLVPCPVPLYRIMARRAGFVSLWDQDITTNIQPGVQFFHDFNARLVVERERTGRTSAEDSAKMLRGLESLCNSLATGMTYSIIAFQK